MSCVHKINDLNSALQLELPSVLGPGEAAQPGVHCWALPQLFRNPFHLHVCAFLFKGGGLAMIWGDDDDAIPTGPW
jgi:hypothetical protein